MPQLNRQQAIPLGLLALAAVVFVALWVVGVVSVPIAGIRSALADGAGRLPSLVAGALPYAVAVSALGLVAWVLRRYFAQRARDLALRERQNDIEMAQLLGDLVVSLQVRMEYGTESDSTPEQRDALHAELDHAIDRYQSVLLGILRARPDLAHTQRQAITAYLNQAQEELRQPSQVSAPWMR